MILLTILHVIETIERVQQDIRHVKKFTDETNSKAANIDQSMVKLKEDYNKTHSKHILHDFSFLYQFFILKLFVNYIERCYIFDQIQKSHNFMPKGKLWSIS